MFAGKTKALFRHVQQGNLFPHEILLVKHAIDTRYQQDYIVSHDGERRECAPIRLPMEIPYLLNEHTKLVAIDEVQFFDNSIVSIISQLMIQQVEVVAAGLLKDSFHQDFGPMPDLLKIATQSEELFSICKVCKSTATHTYRINSTQDQVFIGGANMYEPRCKKCYNTI